MSRKNRLVLAIVLTDATFARATLRDGEAWVGKCLHCGARLVVTLEGDAFGGATIEHIVPRAHGGTDDPHNLALACARCNAEKGVRHDTRRRNDPRRLEVEAQLLAKRAARWREPDDATR